MASKAHSVAVIGANSMTGSRFCDLSQFNLIKTDLHTDISLDITLKDSINKFFKTRNFDTVILFSAFTDVDAAEKQREDRQATCWQINVEGVKNIVDECYNYAIKLIFVSTDFVFDGENGPYSENDPVGSNLNKVSWYGITKIEAEKTIKNKLSDYIILRISYPYRARFAGKDDIAKRILRLYDEDRLYPLFDDQIITPTFIDDIAPAVDLILTQNQAGIFHLASPKVTTHYEFAKRLLSEFKRNAKKVKKTSVVKFLENSGKTPRPVKGGMKVERIKDLGFEPTDWQKGIEAIFDQSQGKLI